MSEAISQIARSITGNFLLIIVIGVLSEARQLMFFGVLGFQASSLRVAVSQFMCFWWLGPIAVQLH